MLSRGQFGYLAFIGVIAILAYCMQGARANAALVILAAAATLSFAANDAWWLTPEQHYRFRTISGLMLFAIILIGASFTFIWKRMSGRTTPGLVVVAMTVFLALYVNFVSYDLGFHRWLRVFETEAIEVVHSVSVEKTRIYARQDASIDHGFNWSWSNPTLSVLLRGMADAVIMNHSTYNGALHH